MRDERALLRWAAEEAGKPLVWGETDCASLVRRGLSVLFGEDRLYRIPAWTSAKEALRALRAEGPASRILEDAGYAPSERSPVTGDVAVGNGGRDFGLVVFGRVLTAGDSRVVLYDARRLRPGTLWSPAR